MAARQLRAFFPYRRIGVAPFGLDNSISAAWCFEDEATSFTESLLDRVAASDSAVVPAIWPYALANTLATAIRRRVG